MKIVIGCDHGGYELKEILKPYLSQKGYELVDFGTNSEASVDYPDIAASVCSSIQKGECERGILICGTGIGMSICANKYKGIRAALCGDCYSARMTRQHNDSNILCLGGRVTGPELAKMIAEIWLSEEFIGMHHSARLDKIKSLEGC